MAAGSGQGHHGRGTHRLLGGGGGLGFRVSGFRVSGLGFQGLGYRVWGLECN